jgi:hypothetical protein
MDDHRERLRALARGLLALHALLMERERLAYEGVYGRVNAGELLRLLLGDEHFAWLRALSSLMARIDELVDTGEPLPARDVERLMGETHGLLKSGDGGAFQDKYRVALQESPDVVMAHARITAVLRAPR